MNNKMYIQVFILYRCKFVYFGHVCDMFFQEVKVNSPDYQSMGADLALRDFLQRIEHYTERYEPLHEETESSLSYMKIFNTGEKVLVHKHEGHIQARIVYYLMNIHIIPRTIYLTRVSKTIYYTVHFNFENYLGPKFYPI